MLLCPCGTGKQAWPTGIAHMQALRQLMRDHGREGRTPQEEFKALLASGALSPAMHQFLTSNLGEHDCLCLWSLWSGMHVYVHND